MVFCATVPSPNHPICVFGPRAEFDCGAFLRCFGRSPFRVGFPTQADSPKRSQFFFWGRGVVYHWRVRALFRAGRAFVSVFPPKLTAQNARNFFFGAGACFAVGAFVRCFGLVALRVGFSTQVKSPNRTQFFLLVPGSGLLWANLCAFSGVGSLRSVSPSRL